MSHGIDTTANAAPHATALFSAGITWVGRYLSHSAWKNVTRAECVSLSKAGLNVVSVWESAGDHESFFTRPQGLLDGAAAYAYAQHIGQPFAAPIYFAVDCDVPGGAVADYFTAVRDSLQKHGQIGVDTYNVGAYGSGAVLAYLKAAGLISFAWLAQAPGWAGYHTFGDYNIKQGPSKTILGMNCDVDEASPLGGGGWQTK